MNRPLPLLPPEVDFNYPLLACADFDQLLAGAGRQVDVLDVLGMAGAHGRVLLQAKAGAGKSTTLSRLLAQASERGIQTHTIRLGEVTIDLSGEDRSFRLTESLEPPPSPADFVDEARLLILIDGLNEIERSQQAWLIEAVDELAARHPNVATVVTDRLTRRSVRTSRWALCGIGPVPDSRVAEILHDRVTDELAPLFANPAYLEQAMRIGSEAASRSSVHERVLTDDGFANDLDTLATFALERYLEVSSRLFVTQLARQRLGQDLFGRAVAAGLVRDLGDGQSRFRHHLVHDYLAAKAAATSPHLWTTELFEKLTFKASSFDALVLLMEQANPGSIDTLLRRVYDYNLYAAAYLLGEDAAGARRATPATAHEILVMLGERRFDQMLNTAEQAADALRLHGSDLAKELLLTSTVDDVYDLATRLLPDDPDYRAWLELYRSEGDTRSLVEPDGVIGWTAANVLRRHLSPEQARSTAELARHPEAVVRWRALHVLGAITQADPALTQLLFERFEHDDARTVRYGALRSLVEHALRTDDSALRFDIFRRFADEVHILKGWSGLKDEFERVLKVAAPPKDWGAAAALTIEELLAASDNEHEQDRWRRLSTQLRLGWDVLQ